MKILIFVGILFYTFLGHASVFKIAGETVSFQDKEGLLISGCDKSCDAIKTIKKFKSINMKKIRIGMKYTNSVGSDVCARVYKGNSLLGVAENRDGRAFCLFPDRSMVEMNSLSDYLVKNKIVQE